MFPGTYALNKHMLQCNPIYAGQNPKEQNFNHHKNSMQISVNKLLVYNFRTFDQSSFENNVENKFSVPPYNIFTQVFIHKWTSKTGQQKQVKYFAERVRNLQIPQAQKEMSDICIQYISLILKLKVYIAKIKVGRPITILYLSSQTR